MKESRSGLLQTILLQYLSPTFLVPMLSWYTLKFEISVASITALSHRCRYKAPPIFFDISPADSMILDL